jgi:hypothetical protein
MGKFLCLNEVLLVKIEVSRGLEKAYVLLEDLYNFESFFGWDLL